MSTEAKQLLAKAGLRSSEFWGLVIGIVATPVAAKLGVESSVLIAMWGTISAYIAGRTLHKNARVKALAALESNGAAGQEAP